MSRSGPSAVNAVGEYKLKPVCILGGSGGSQQLHHFGGWWPDTEDMVIGDYRPTGFHGSFWVKKEGLQSHSGAGI